MPETIVADPRQSLLGKLFQAIRRRFRENRYRLIRDLTQVETRIQGSQAFRVLDCRLPRPVPVETSTGHRAGHTGKLELPIWGLLDSELPLGAPVDLEIVATVQACDRTTCLAPSDVVLEQRLWVEPERGETP